MGVRRVVTGHSPDGRAIVVSDDQVAPFAIGEHGSATTVLWGRDEAGQYPDDGSPPGFAAAFPPPGGSRCAVMELAPVGDDFHQFVRTALAPWADQLDAGMHRTPSTDYNFVLEGTVGLELDGGAEVLLEAGDIVVQNATRHRWHNRGMTVARVLSVVIGAHDQRG
jgi:mannose-6-phosphate isomerase-like protein (cupin superfamily)